MSYTVSILIRAVDRASGVLRGITGVLRRFGLELGAVGGAVAGLAVALATELVDALEKAADAVQECVDAYARYEWVLVRVATATGALGEEARLLADRFEELTRQIGVEMGVGASRAAEALEALVKAGLEGQEALEALQATLMLAQIELMDTGEAANYVASILRAFSLPADQAAHVVDVLVNASIKGIATARDFAYALSYCSGIAAQLGLSLEETVAALVAMNNQGIQAAYAGRYLMHMLQDLIEHANELGFSIYDSSGHLLSLSEIIARLEARLAQFSSDEERAAYLTEIFGTQGLRAALALLHASYAGLKGSEALRALAEALGAAGTAEAIFEEQMGTLAGVLARANARIQEAMLAIGEALAPAVDVASEAFSKLVQVLAKALAPFLEKAAYLMEELVALAERVAEEAWPIIKAFLDVLLEAFSAVCDVLADFLDRLAENEWAVRALAYSLVALLMALNPLLTAVVAITAAVEKAGSAGEKLRSIVEAIRDALAGLVEWLKEAREAVSGFFESIADSARELYEELVGGSVWTDMLTEMSSSLSDHMASMEEEFRSHVKGMEEAAEELASIVAGHGSLTVPGGPLWGRPLGPYGAVFRPAGLEIHIHIGSFTARRPEDVELLAREVCRHIARELRLLGAYVA